MGHSIISKQDASEAAGTFLRIGAMIDRCGQSRTDLLDLSSEIRDAVAESYGDDFEDDLLSHLGYETPDEDEALEDADDADENDEEEAD